MDLNSLIDKTMWDVLLPSILFFVIAEEIRMEKTCALFGIAFGILGSWILLYGELKQNAADINAESKNHSSSFEDAVQNHSVSNQMIIKLTNMLPDTMFDFWDRIPPGILENYCAKVKGFGCLFIGFILQFVGVWWHIP